MKICPTCATRFADDQPWCPEHRGEPLLALSAVPAVAADDPLVGRLIDDRYLILAPIGQGGMGTVYRAWQRRVRREVAIKVVRADRADALMRRRFAREAEVTASLRSPHTVTVFDSGELDDGSLYMVMELLTGRTLAAILAEDGPQPVALVRRLALQICDSLAEAHGRGLVHRDLKPANLIVSDRGAAGPHVTVLDFGVVKLPDLGGDRLTREGAAVGSLRTMAPEQLDGRPVGPAADVYALGVTLYHLLTGAPPFEGDTALALMVAHRTAPAPKLSEALGRGPTVAALDAILQRCLAKDPAHRFADGAALGAALAATPPGGGVGVEAIPHRPAPRTRRVPRTGDPAQLPNVSTDAVHRRLTERRLGAPEEAARGGRARSVARAVLITAAVLLGLYVVLDAAL